LRKNEKPLVYIILINWNGLEDTLECLESLRKIAYPKFRVIVVDNGSKDNQADIIKEKFPEVKLIRNNRNMGYVIANNQGIELALKRSADYILLLNNDIVVERNFLNILINYAERNKDFGILSPKILYYDSNKIWSVGGKILPGGITILTGKGKDHNCYTTEVIETDFVSGCAMLIKRSVIETIGFLDPIYFAYFEDADFCLRAKNFGYKIVVIPKSVIYHKKSSSSGKRGSFRRLSPLQYYLLTRNQILFIKKFSRWKIASIIVTIAFRLAYLLVYNKLDIESLKSLIRGAIDGITSKGAIFRNGTK